MQENFILTMNIINETQELIFREYTHNDFYELRKIISDPDVMKYFAKPYDDDGVRHWIDWCIQSYSDFGFGLWAVILKENGQYIGDCGISIQIAGNKFVPEIGYHLKPEYWGKGIATKAAAACKEWAFLNTPFNKLYSIMNEKNVASYRVALKNGMMLESCEQMRGICYNICSISREEWQKKK